MRSIPSIIRAIATKGITGAYRELLPEASRDSIAWINRQGIAVQGARVLEVGCGFGATAALLREQGADVIAIDIEPPRVLHAQRDGVQVALADANALQFKDETLDLILCINVLEHLEEPRRFVDEAYRCLRPGRHLYLTWTNWYSPMGGHDFTPFHYLGPRLGYRLACKLRRKERFIQVPYQTMWPIHIGPTLRLLKESGFRILKITPRYYPSLSFICRIPALREFLTVNCQVLLQKPASGPVPSASRGSA